MCEMRIFPFLFAVFHNVFCVSILGLAQRKQCRQHGRAHHCLPSTAISKVLLILRNINLNLNTGLRRNRRGRETKLLGLINGQGANEAKKGGGPLGKARETQKWGGR